MTSGQKCPEIRRMREENGDEEKEDSARLRVYQSFQFTCGWSPNFKNTQKYVQDSSVQDRFERDRNLPFINVALFLNVKRATSCWLRGLITVPDRIACARACNVEPRQFLGPRKLFYARARASTRRVTYKKQNEFLALGIIGHVMRARWAPHSKRVLHARLRTFCHFTIRF